MRDLRSNNGKGKRTNGLAGFQLKSYLAGRRQAFTHIALSSTLRLYILLNVVAVNMPLCGSML